jgi:hypothetical protein
VCATASLHIYIIYKRKNHKKKRYMGADDFHFDESASPPEKKKRKRQEEETGPTRESSLAIARSFCSCPEQWETVRRYPAKKLSQFIETERFRRDAGLRESFFGSLHRFYGFVLDKLTMGEGHVQSHLERDVSLRHALEEEFQSVLCYLNNRMKIGLLSANGVMSGKIEQRAQTEGKIEVIKENEGTDGDNTTRDQPDLLQANSELAHSPPDPQEGGGEAEDEEV